MLLDGKNHTISIPLEKRTETLQMVHLFCDKKKATVKELQKLAGHLNFINRAVVPGCTFTRRMYAKFAGLLSTLKPYHHIRLDSEFKADCRIWISFLTELDSVVRPFIDLNETLQADTLNFYTDASANSSLGFGGIFDKEWFLESGKVVSLINASLALSSWN